MTLFSDLRNLKPVPFGDLDHLLDLAVYGKDLLFLAFCTLSCIQTVGDLYWQRWIG